MNPYKLRAIIELVRRQGRLPTDRWGCVLNPDDLLVWYGLNSELSLEEQREVKRELAALAEAEGFVDRLQPVRQ